MVPADSIVPVDQWTASVTKIYQQNSFTTLTIKCLYIKIMVIPNEISKPGVIMQKLIGRCFARHLILWWGMQYVPLDESRRSKYPHGERLTRIKYLD